MRIFQFRRNNGENGTKHTLADIINKLDENGGISVAKRTLQSNFNKTMGCQRNESYKKNRIMMS